MRERKKTPKKFLIFFILNTVNAQINVQREFDVLIQNAHDSCKGLIATCEKPFIGFDIKSGKFILEFKKFDSRRNQNS